MQKIFLCLATAAFLNIINFAFAAEQVYYREYKYQASEADSKIIARAIALQQVKQILLGELGTHVSALVKQNINSEGRSLDTVQIETLSAGIVRVEILEEHWNGETYLLKAQIKADPAEVLSSLNRMLDTENKQAQIKQLGGDFAQAQTTTIKISEELVRTRKENTAALVEIERLKGELAKQQNQEARNELQVQYQQQASQLSNSEIFDEAIRQFKAKNFKSSFALFTKLAEQGYVNAQFILGWMYDKGDVVSRNAKQAVYWYTKAAEQGKVGAQVNLGLIYVNGGGVTRDPKQAVYWYTKAAEQGDADAQIKLGGMYEKSGGVNRDLKQAVYWYTKAAEQGDVDVQAKLGVMYYYGEGLPSDYNQAVFWFTKAAEQGNPHAQFLLAVMYDKGEGVYRAPQKVVYWITKAAEQGLASAQYGLGMMFYNGEGVTRDIKKTVSLWTKAAEQGDVAAQYGLGIMYRKGEGVAHDNNLAAYWFTQAAKQGNEKAVDALQALKK